MDKESKYLLQKIDCNCNDCIYMQRNFDRYNQSVQTHYQWQLDYFEAKKQRLITSAFEWKQKGELEKHNALLKEAKQLKFQFDKTSASIHYGFCSKLKKDISFLPNTCQLHTQQCFLHRKNATNN